MNVLTGIAILAVLFGGLVYAASDGRAERRAKRSERYYLEEAARAEIAELEAMPTLTTAAFGIAPIKKHGPGDDLDGKAAVA